MNTVTRLIAENPVVVFSNGSCSCMRHSIKSLICNFGANPIVFEIDGIPNGEQIEKALQQQGYRLLAVFIGQKFIGGAKEVMSLNLRNELRPLLIKARAIWL